MGPVPANGGLEAIDYLTEARSAGLLVVSLHPYLLWETINHMIMLFPEPFLPLQHSDHTLLADLMYFFPEGVIYAIIKPSNKMGTARRYNLVKFLLTLQRHQQNLWPSVISHPEGVLVITRVGCSVLFH